MTQRDLIFFRSAEIAVFGKEREDRGIEVLEQTSVERDADQQRYNALRDGFHVVQRVRVVRRDAYPGRSPHVVPIEVLLVHEYATPGDNNAMRIGSFQFGETRADSADQLRVEPLLRGRRNLPTIGHSRRSIAIG